MTPSRCAPKMAVEDKSHHAGGWLETWHVNPSLSKDYDAIDGLRGIAILFVVLCHLVYVNPAAGPLTQFVGGIFGAGTWGVTLFFTLSGFLISHPFWKRKVQGSAEVIPPGYGRRRFWKIYPPLALSIVLLTPLYIAHFGEARAFAAVAGQWLMGWPLVHAVSGRLNPVMWSLIVEVHFYILLPLLFLALKRFSARRCLATIFLLLLIVPTGVRWWYLSRGIHFELHPRIEIRFPIWLDAFAFGVLAAGLENLQIMKKSWARCGDVGSLLLMIAIPTLSWSTLHPVVDPSIQLEALTVLVKVASGLMLCYVADANHPRSRLLSAPWLRWCGLISYEWYLFHQPFILWTRDLFGPASGNPVKYLLILLSSFPVGLILAAVVYRYFSLPILRYGRSRRGVL